MKKIIAAVFIIAVLGMMISFLVSSNQPKIEPPAVNQPIAMTPTANPIKFSGQAKIEIPATVPAGDNLTVTKLIMPGHGFIVIKDKTGKIVDASNLIIFPETDNLSMAVALISGRTYIAELHGDNGNGIFDEQTDPPIIIGGQTISTTFKAK